MEKEVAEKQWLYCAFCGRPMVKDQKVVERLIAGGKTREEAEEYTSSLCYLVCPVKHDNVDMVPFEQLEHGAYYHGNCRNAHIARWNAEKQHFVHWRTKFDNVYTETIGYWIEAKPGEHRFDEFKPFGKLAEPPFEIPLED